MYNNKEKECCWIFPENAGDDQGVNSSDSQLFNGYDRLVRETIQNSLDAVSDVTKPVRVEISKGFVKKIYYNHFFELERHIEACIEYFDNKNTKDSYTEISRRLDDIKKYNDYLDFISISDSNTKGMEYDAENRTGCSFYNFALCSGNSDKTGGSGGSYGLGKNVYYESSPLKCFFVSTMTEKEGCTFIGKAKLCSHKIDDKRYSPIGSYTKKLMAEI